ncbi:MULTISPECIES: histidine phosphatase family protein [Agrobacterium]|jgi:broad specificity phosphatase PhoE|uniref:Broad specificity phosphatase PhoE n=1 Tax=Agrobacterium tumefaciens TaxID=358 RepID=A0AAP9E5F9_AGRTU|nr:MULTISPECIES: histidine phosphatase family protein [Agrobacterium]MBP2563666.1 broad specificity phosphatase PhoE [Agrobacterium tumefaciens]MBP2569097.1 broad specificity phosphatase PhoE [Agrobacterium tumefaciens]MDR6702471.1 broad specificity phosphatase PhoE [Agrobacterium tumefaciens]NSZ56429.1 histidine phosphatase family protein [Agrobacterium tumefaciens]QDY95259.1 histidine phosphatase family protein [Agrobacterium tumefaciens]
MHALYITHPQVKIDADVPVPEWGLSERGAERAREASRLPWARSLRRIVSSAETKAIETARILAETSQAEIEIVEAMHENDRSATGFLPPPEFEKAADWFFANPEESFHGWERAIDAQARIVGAVKAVFERHDPRQPIAFVGHGGVGTLLKCHIEGRDISRSKDQPPGGGNLFHFSIAEFSLAAASPTCDWTAMETWQG